jgi:hypothetical protein
VTAVITSALLALARRANRSHGRAGRPFDPRTPIAPPHGPRSSWVHYGVMVPGLPEPYRTFGVMSIVGTPGVAIFANDHAITTTPNDTAYLVSATAAMSDEGLHVYSIARDCEFREGFVRFGDDLTIEGVYPHFQLRRSHRESPVQLDIVATDKVSYFADLPGGLYSHWSLLCRYEGAVGDRAIDGLCTFEYATGAGMHSLPLPVKPNIPVPFFTYHVLNANERTQILMGLVLGPGGIDLVRATNIRGLDDYGCELLETRFEVEDYAQTHRPTPDGREMRMPATLTWSASDHGAEVVSISGRCNGDWVYGLGAGFVGSYDYSGSFRGTPIEGTAYIEYIDLR